MTHINYIHCNKTLHQMTEFQEMQNLISVLLVKYPFTTGVAKVHGSTEQDGFDPQSQHPLSTKAVARCHISGKKFIQSLFRLPILVSDQNFELKKNCTRFLNNKRTEEVLQPWVFIDYHA
jgi:hypothetical protein